MGSLLSRSGPLARLPFTAAGVVLFAIKIALDALVARAFDQPYSPLFYLSPLDAPLLSPGGRIAYWLSMWALALPFIAIGVWLTARRLRDAAMPGWLVALFFVPFANVLFFLVVAALPSRPSAPVTTEASATRRSFGSAIVMGGASGAVIALGMVAVSVGLLREYGAALFIGAPTISAFVATLVFGRLHGLDTPPDDPMFDKRRTLGSLAASVIALTIAFVTMLAFAIEGLVCLLMASPLAVAAGAVGWGVGLLTISFADKLRSPGTAVSAILPFWLVAEIVTPLPVEHDRMIESAIDIAAPPAIVFERVLAFEDLPPPDELLFRAGVAYPTGAVIEGRGVGAIRRCRFSTGEFVEPITAWVPGRELAFDVQQQPDPMREMTPWRGPRPPHLDGYFASTRGQFLLEPIEGGTRLHGRTWYRLDVFPRAYWALWSETFVHTIHMRVLRRIAELAERDVSATR